MINRVVSFKQLQTIKTGGLKLPVDYKVVLKDEADCFVRTNLDYEDNKTCTVIDSDDVYDIAQSRVEIDKENKILINNNIDVLRKQYRGKGFGIILHLNNIIEMFENNLQKIRLFSLGQSVLFHAKCGFEPDISSPYTMEYVIFDISAKDCHDMPEIKETVKKANNFANKLIKAKNHPDKYKVDCKEGNAIIKEYLDIITKKKLSSQERALYGFDSGFPMVLTKEKILENKDFFNGLFKKFGIDYEV